jgi:hypothetical protein
MGKKSEFKRFDEAMGALLSVSHDELKAKLDAEKAAKKGRKSKASAEGRASRAKD